MKMKINITRGGRMMKRIFTMLFGALVMVMLGGEAHADQRSYVWTYEYLTLAKDSAEVEFNQTAVTKDRQKDSSSDWQQQLELEYGITDRLDAALYQVYEQKVDADNVFEGKLVLAKDIGKLNIAYNQIYKNTYTSGDRADHEYAAGASFEITPAIRFSVESKGNFRTDKYAAGPTLSWVGGRIWANLGAVYGLNRRTNDREVRF